jgi:hypothetical protein
MPKPLKGVGYELNSTNKGFSLSIDDPAYVEPGDNLMLALNLPPFPDIPLLPTPETPGLFFEDKILQFECRVTPLEGLQYLQIAKGSVTYSQSNMPLVKSSPKTVTKQCYIDKAAVFEEVDEFDGGIADSPWMLNGGGYLLGGPGTWIVALCKWDLQADGFDGTGLTMPPLLAEERPFIVIYKEGGTMASWINSETGPSLYSNETNVQKMTGYDAEATGLDGDFGYCHTTWFNPSNLCYSMRTIAKIDSGVPDNIAPTVTRVQAANPETGLNEIHRLNINTIPSAGDFKLDYTESITGTSDPFDPLFGGEFELGVSLSIINAIKGNIAVQQHSADAYDIVYANNLQGTPITLPTITDNTLDYFNETYVVTQCAVGSQDIVIELNFHGSMLKNIPGLTEETDPYNVSESNDWNAIVNIDDIFLFEDIEENLDWFTDISTAPTTMTNVNYLIADTCETSANGHPFQVIFTGVDSSGEEPVNKFKVISGTVNNVIPNNIDDEFSSFTVAQNIYLKVPIDDTVDPALYPSTTDVEIINSDSSSPFVDTDTEGYLLLATMDSDGTITQFVQGSVWSERHKYTEPDSATYYYYRV